MYDRHLLRQDRALTLNEMTARRFVFRARRFSVTGGGYTANREIRLDAAEGVRDPGIETGRWQGT